jgi:truncated hemoglobin YjbI
MPRLPSEARRATGWVQVMDRALDETDLPEEVHQSLKEFFANTATFLMNRPE